MLMAAIASASASASVAVRGHERKKPPSQFDEPPVVVDGEPVRATVAASTVHPLEERRRWRSSRIATAARA